MAGRKRRTTSRAQTAPAAPSGDGRRARWDAHRESRRRELVDAAIEAIRRHGAGIGMDEIATEASTSKPVLYRYFADRTELYLAVCERAATPLLETLTEALSRPGGPRALLEAGIDAYLGFIEREPELYRFVVQHPLVDRRPAKDPVADYSTLIALHVARIIGDAARELGLDSGVAEPWAHGLVGMVRAAGDAWLGRPAMSRSTLASYLVDLSWTGVGGALAAAGADVAVDSPRHLVVVTGGGSAVTSRAAESRTRHTPRT